MPSECAKSITELIGDRAGEPARSPALAFWHPVFRCQEALASRGGANWNGLGERGPDGQGFRAPFRRYEPSVRGEGTTLGESAVPGQPAQRRRPSHPGTDSGGRPRAPSAGRFRADHHEVVGVLAAPQQDEPSVQQVGRAPSRASGRSDERHLVERSGRRRCAGPRPWSVASPARTRQPSVHRDPPAPAAFSRVRGRPRQPAARRWRRPRPRRRLPNSTAAACSTSRTARRRARAR